MRWVIQQQIKVHRRCHFTSFFHDFLNNKLNLNFFVVILVQTMTPKGHFEIN